VNALRPSIGVVALAKNEEKDLPGFLSNVLPWADEVVIVDDGSTDKTAAVALEAGPKVKVIRSAMHPASGFAGLRNEGILHATSEWLLHMDIDERVPPSLISEIFRAIAEPDVVACRFRRLNFFLNRPMKGGGLQLWNQVHLARREIGIFVNTVHEGLQLRENSGKVKQLKAKMLHLNDDGYLERMRKSDQYCRMVADQLLRDGKAVSGWHLFWKPAKKLFLTYFIFKGYKDGIPGIIWAMHCACAEFRVLALAWDRQNPKARQGATPMVEPGNGTAA
jgi:glycosyltransferase involved in cell wall biosynthesis